MGLLDVIAADVDAPHIPADGELAAISTLAERQTKLEFDISCKSEELSGLQEELKRVCEVLLPEAMAVVNMEEFRLANGTQVVIKKDTFASIRADKKVEAFKWLGEHSLGAIVKDSVTVTFDKGEGKKAQEMMEFCIDKGFLAKRESSVHAGTLKATVKLEMSKGVEFPDDTFSIFPYKKSKIELPKVKKAKK